MSVHYCSVPVTLIPRHSTIRLVVRHRNRNTRHSTPRNPFTQLHAACSEKVSESFPWVLCFYFFPFLSLPLFPLLFFSRLLTPPLPGLLVHKKDLVFPFSSMVLNLVSLLSSVSHLKLDKTFFIICLLLICCVVVIWSESVMNPSHTHPPTASSCPSILSLSC